MAAGAQGGLLWVCVALMSVGTHFPATMARTFYIQLGPSKLREGLMAVSKALSPPRTPLGGVYLSSKPCLAPEELQDLWNLKNPMW